MHQMRSPFLPPTRFFRLAVRLVGMLVARFAGEAGQCPAPVRTEGLARFYATGSLSSSGSTKKLGGEHEGLPVIGGRIAHDAGVSQPRHERCLARVASTRSFAPDDISGSGRAQVSPFLQGRSVEPHAFDVFERLEDGILVPAVVDGRGWSWRTVHGCMLPGHHRLDATAVLDAVHALRVTSAGTARSGSLRPRVPRGCSALTAPPRSANDGIHVMANDRRLPTRTPVAESRAARGDSPGHQALVRPIIRVCSMANLRCGRGARRAGERGDGSR